MADNSTKYLDNNGLIYLLGKLKALFNTKVDKVDGKGLSTEDYTSAEKTKLAGIAAGAQVNTVTGVKGNSESSYRTGQINLTAANVGAAASSHTHGNIQNGGTLQTTDVAIANGDKLVVTDASDSSKVARTSIAFDGSTATKALTQKGTWETFNNYSLPTASASTKGGVKIGSGLTMTGEVLSADVQENPVMTGATSSAAGAAGTVPAPAKGDQAKYLKGDGTWDVPADEKVKTYAIGSGRTMYLTGSPESPSSNPGANQLLGDPNIKVIVDSNGNACLYVNSISASGGALTELNASAISSGTVAAARLPAATQSAQGAMSAADKTKLDAFGAASTYALKSDITSMYRHKGSVATQADLPTTGVTAGDVYNVTATGMNYVYVDSTTGWDALGEVFTITSLSNSDIDTIWTSAMAA